MLSVRPFQAGDKAALYEMLQEVWPDQTSASLDRRWWWDTGTPPLLLAEEAGQLAGMCGVIPFAAAAQDESHQGAWIVDFFVRARYQGKGIGKKLVRAAMPQVEFLASLNQTDAAYATFSRLGWSGREFIPLFMLPSPLVFRLATLGRRPGHGAYSVSTGTASFGAEFDTLWAECRAGAAMTSTRDSAALGARFSGPRRAYKVIRVTEGGRLAGYAVIRTLPPGGIRSFPRFRILMVSDYLVSSTHPDAWGVMLGEVVRQAVAEQVHFVLCMSSVPDHQAVLRGSGFLSARTPIIGKKLRKLDVGFTTTPEGAGRQWHLTPFDCDLDLLFGGST